MPSNEQWLASQFTWQYGAWVAPWLPYGNRGCAASPNKVTLPKSKDFNGSRSNKLHPMIFSVLSSGK